MSKSKYNEKAYQKQYRKTHRAELNEYHIMWVAAHPDWYRKYRKKYYQDHKEEMQKYMREYMRIYNASRN